MTLEKPAAARMSRSRPWLLLLLIPVVAVGWPALYSFPEPTLAGLPFFYWYLLLWVFAETALMALVSVLAGE